jgi:hypothetical protein
VKQQRRGNKNLMDVITEMRSNLERRDAVVNGSLKGIRVNP